jgi:hypothetical protein
MDDILKIAERLSSVGLATLLLLVLIGNKLRIWRWGADYLDQEARHRQEKVELLERVKYWQDLSERFLGLAETQGQLLKVRGANVSQIDEANRRLLDGGR